MRTWHVRNVGNVRTPMESHLSRRLQRCAIALYLSLFARRALAQHVEITAEIQITAFRSDQADAEPKTTPKTFSVVCIVGTNQWRIENDWARGGLNKWFFDGTNIYESIQVTSPPTEEMQGHLKETLRPAIVPFDQAKSNLTIHIWPTQDGHPLGDVGVNIPWLAFCSGPCLKREARLISLPCEILRHTPDRYAYSDKTETFPDVFGLPLSIDLFLSTNLYLSSVDDFYQDWGSDRGDRYSESMKNAVTNLKEGTITFHYAATATTNFLGWTFPLQFELSQKGRAFIQNGSWDWRGKGTLKSIREGAEPQSLFNPSLQQTIVDWRFRDETTGANANIYEWTNTFTPQTDDPALQEKFKKRVENIRRRKENGK
jgi:hypothetical protein